jgi:hypothetical protein
MVEAIITGMILMVFAGITALILQCIPKRILDKVWVKLHMDNDEPYKDDSY